MEVIRSKMSLNRKFLHLLILEQLQSLNLSLGIGEVYYGLHFLPRCKVNFLSRFKVNTPTIQKIGLHA